MKRMRRRRTRNTGRCVLIERFVAVKNVIMAIIGCSPANVPRGRIGLIKISKKIQDALAFISSSPAPLDIPRSADHHRIAPVWNKFSISSFPGMPVTINLKF